jgi:hypothetical protein
MASMTSADGVLQTIAFPFKDKNWLKKVAIGSALALLSGLLVPAIIISGYAFRIMKQVINKNEDPTLPEWEDWGGLLRDGFRLWGAGMIYSLPMLLLMFAGWGVMFVPWIIEMVNLSSQQYASPDSMGVIFIPMMIGMGMIFLAIPLGLVTSFLQAPALGHLVARDSFKAAFRIKEWWPILRTGIGIYIVEVLVMMGVSFLGNMAIQILYFTIILACLTPFAMAIYLFLTSIYSHTFIALAYRDARKKMDL